MRQESEHYETFIPYSKVTSKRVIDRMRRYVNLAKDLKDKGYSSGGRTFNVTFVAKKSKLVAIGLNDYSKVMDGYNHKLKTHTKFYGESSYNMCLHAEISAILKLGMENCEGLDFYNVRLNKNGSCVGSTFPCSNCLRMLKRARAKNIYVYDENMNICMLNI